MKDTSFGLAFIVLLGSAIFLSCIIPVTTIETVISTSFSISPGTTYGPDAPGTSYHTRILSRSILLGEVVCEEGIYLTVNYYNTQHLQNISITDQVRFVISPANDLYVFVFDNTNGLTECTVQFTLEEIWITPLAFSSPLWLVSTMIAVLIFIIGFGILLKIRLPLSKKTLARE